MALDHAAEGIRVNCVCPGIVHTPMLERRFAMQPDREAAWRAANARPPVQYIGRPEDVAAAIAYLILQTALLRAEGEQSRLRVALGSDFKGKISPLLYCVGIALSFANGYLGLAVYVAVALIWLVPDRRVERHLAALGGEVAE
jgi:hypothetical protein